MHNIAITAVFRGENKWLREWIEYHSIIGVDHFFLYNNEDIGSPDYKEAKAILKPYTDIGLVEHLLHRDRSGDFQLTHIKESIAYATYCQVNWLCILDLDEFIFPVAPHSLKNILTTYEIPNCRALSISCCTFGTSGLKKSPKLVTESFIQRGALDCVANYTAKNFIRPPEREGNQYNEDYSVSKIKKCPRPMEILRVNHYGTKSLEDWALKVKRGQPSGSTSHQELTPEVWAHKFTLLNQNTITDTGMYKYIPELKKRLYG